MPLVVQPSPDEAVITINYDGSGLGWVDLWDNYVIAWIVDEIDVTSEPQPRILGSFPPPAADTGEVVSPVWASVGRNGVVYVADQWRGRLDEFFTWLATNNGAHRPVIGQGLSSRNIRQAYDTWAASHPDLALADYPDEPEAEAGQTEAGPRQPRQPPHHRRRRRG